MSTVKTPKDIWQRDSVAVAVEWMELAGEPVPLSFSHVAVQDRQINHQLFYAIDWFHPWSSARRRPGGEELAQARAAAHTTRRLTPRALREGERPGRVYGLVGQIIAAVARNRLLVV